jgi:hypothetical protein
MEFLVPLMPLLGSLPIAVAAVLIARMVLRQREARGRAAEQLEQLAMEVETLRAGQSELQERVDFAERLLGQLKDASKLGP